MYWQKMTSHLTHYANELADTGYENEANYVRNEIIPKLRIDSDRYNERGKKKLLNRLDRLEEGKE